MKRLARIVLVCVLPVLLVASSACGSRPRTMLRVFASGSVRVPMAVLAIEYGQLHPNVEVQFESHGSTQVIRHVTEMNEPIDVVATSDGTLLEKLMYSTTNPSTGTPYAQWNIRFARDQMMLVYTIWSRYANEITPDNWTEILARPDVRFGLSDPRFDATGYRALMILQLAGQAAGKATYVQDLFSGRFTSSITVADEGPFTSVRVPEVIEPRSGSGIVFRGVNSQLMPLLKLAEIDYIFETSAACTQAGASGLLLSPLVNLGDPEHAADYQRACVRLDFRRFSTVAPEFCGEPIEYAVTITNAGAAATEAERFLAFVLGPRGRTVLEQDGYQVFDQPTVDHPELLPETLAALCVPR